MLTSAYLHLHLHNRVASLAGHFRPYDYGTLPNLKFYRRFVPPEYPVEKITAPVILYNGLNDILAAPNVIKCITNLPLYILGVQLCFHHFFPKFEALL